jgi:DDE domain
MSGDAHVRICESLGVQFPRATRLYLKIAGRMVYLWRAVDAEGEVLDVLVQSRGGLYIDTHDDPTLGCTLISMLKYEEQRREMDDDEGDLDDAPDDGEDSGQSVATWAISASVSGFFGRPGRPLFGLAW